MNKNIENGPDMRDVEVFESGATYLRVHFVSKKYKDKTELSVIKSMANRAKALNIVDQNGLLNMMFRTETEAKEFAKSL